MIQARETSAGPGPGHRRTVVAGGVAAVLALAACGGTGAPAPGVADAPPPDFRADGIRALDAGDFSLAEGLLRRAVARCDAGDDARDALLGLATLHLDLRNPAGSPDEAARLAALHLSLKDADAEGRTLARTLYLTALYRGAEPVEGPDDLRPGEVDAGGDAAGEADPSGADAADQEGPGGPDPFRALEACDDDRVAWRGLPAYPGVPPARWSGADTAAAEVEPAADQLSALRARVSELEAELARIRKLLRGGGGGGPSGPR